jgi:predicted metal-dependent peptidase
MSDRADKLRKIAANGAWDHPFFLPPLSQVTFRERTDMPKTMMIDAEGNLDFHPEDFDKLNDAERAGSVFHEIMHPLSRHHERRGERKQGLWNIASDMTINEFLRGCNVKLPADVYYPPSGLENHTAEAIYDALKDDPEWQKKGEAAEKGEPGVGKGCGCKKGEHGGEKDADWAKAAAQAEVQARKMPGVGKGDAFVRVTKGRPPGIDWGRYIRGVANEALSAHGRDVQSLSRRNRRSPASFVLPGWKAVHARIAVVIDSSGSVSDKMLERAIVHTCALSNLSGLRIYLVVHDHGVQWEGWLGGATYAKVERTLKGRGGTDAHEAYLKVGQQRGTFDAMVHLTDGELSWPAKPTNVRKMVCAVYGGEAGSRYWQTPPAGTVVVPVEV